jgi:hypothetical protein
MNLYAYCLNNSLNRTDPSGCYWMYFNPNNPDSNFARFAENNFIDDDWVMYWCQLVDEGYTVALCFEDGDLSEANRPKDANFYFYLKCMSSEMLVYPLSLSDFIDLSVSNNNSTGIDYSNLSWLDCWITAFGHCIKEYWFDGVKTAWYHDSSTIAEYGAWGQISSYVGYAAQAGLTVAGGITLGTYAANWIAAFSAANNGSVVGSILTGFTRHGLNRIISYAIPPAVVKDTLLNPISIVPQIDGKLKYVGRDAVIVLNKMGQVITAWRLY